jgi:hypothetical protein
MAVLYLGVEGAEGTGSLALPAGTGVAPNGSPADMGGLKTALMASKKAQTLYSRFWLSSTYHIWCTSLFRSSLPSLSSRRASESIIMKFLCAALLLLAISSAVFAARSGGANFQPRKVLASSLPSLPNHRP